MTQTKSKSCIALLLFVIFLAAPGCVATAPVGPQKGSVVKAAESRPRGAAYQEMVARYGGVYRDPKVSLWLSTVGQSLAAHCGRPDIPFTFTILDTGEINAFSTPGGDIYVTRGLLALADNEAEVAAALSHEMGHLIHGDQGERYRQSQETGLAGLFSGSPGWGRPNFILTTERIRFTQDQEFRADEAGIQIMATSGYDPRAMASLLAAVDREAQSAVDTAAPYARPLADTSYGDSHPLTAERVAAAARLASLNHSGNDRSSRDLYLQAVDGLLYGAGSGQGYVRNHVFVHPAAGITFRLPDGFIPRSTRSAFIATRADGAALVLTSAAPGTAASPYDYLTEIWARDIVLDTSDPITVNGRPGAIATAHILSDLGPVDVRLIAIGWSPSLVYRMIFIAPAYAGVDLQACIDTSAGSFRALSKAEAARIAPFRLHVVAAQPQDTLGMLLRHMAADVSREELFRTLNRLAPSDSIRSGRQYKLVE